MHPVPGPTAKQGHAACFEHLHTKCVTTRNCLAHLARVHRRRWDGPVDSERTYWRSHHLTVGNMFKFPSYREGLSGYSPDAATKIVAYVKRS